MNIAARFADTIYRGLLRLYPAEFRALFAEEMYLVFMMALQDATQSGAVPALTMFLREAGDLPVAILLEHIHERRKLSMNLLSLERRQDIRVVRWAARLLSLLPVGLYLIILFLNEDVRSEPALPFIIQGVLTVFTLASWRWEREGGRLTMIGAIILLVILALNAILQANFTPGLGVLISAAVATPYLVVGWLFYSIGQHGELASAARPAGEPPASKARSLAIILAFGGLGLLLIVFFLPGLFVASPQGVRVESPVERCIMRVQLDPAAAVAQPSEALPRSLRGYELYSNRVGNDWAFTMSASLKRVRSSDETNAPFYEEGTAFTIIGIEALKVTLSHLPPGETVTWCDPERPEPTVVDEIEAYSRNLGINLSRP